MDLQIEHPELQGWPRLVETWSVEARHPLLPGADIHGAEGGECAGLSRPNGRRPHSLMSVGRSACEIVGQVLTMCHRGRVNDDFPGPTIPVDSRAEVILD